VEVGELTAQRLVLGEREHTARSPCAVSRAPAGRFTLFFHGSEVAQSLALKIFNLLRRESPLIHLGDFLTWPKLGRSNGGANFGG
jgi:hypothetical protein